MFALKAFLVEEIYLHIFLHAALDGVRSAPRPGRCMSGEKNRWNLLNTTLYEPQGRCVFFGVKTPSFLKKIKQDSLIIQAVT